MTITGLPARSQAHQPSGPKAVSDDPLDPAVLAKRMIDRYDRGSSDATSRWTPTGDGGFQLGGTDKKLERDELPLARFGAIAGYDGDASSISHADMTAAIDKLMTTEQRKAMRRDLDALERVERPNHDRQLRPYVLLGASTITLMIAYLTERCFGVWTAGPVYALSGILLVASFFDGRAYEDERTVPAAALLRHLDVGA